jgi:hypothetical protein
MFAQLSLGLVELILGLKHAQTNFGTTLNQKLSLKWYTLNV